MGVVFAKGRSVSSISFCFKKLDSPILVRSAGQSGSACRSRCPWSLILVSSVCYALVMGQLGGIALAAHQVAINYATLVYMIPVGLSSATMVRVGQSIGRRQVAQARFRGCLGIVTAIVLLTPFSILVALAPEFVIHIYTRDSAVVPVAAILLAIAVGFIVMDGVKIVGEGALRGSERNDQPDGDFSAFNLASWISGSLVARYLLGRGACRIVVWNGAWEWPWRRF